MCNQDLNGLKFIFDRKMASYRFSECVLLSYIVMYENGWFFPNFIKEK